MKREERASVPRMGYGTWNRTSEEAYRGVLWALEAGYRHLDTAQGYQNEADVGRALKDSGVSRGEVFVTTKVAPENYGPGRVMKSVQRSLQKLGLDCVDLLLLHWPSPHDELPLESYASQLAEVFDQGLAAAIGVSNFTIPLLDEAQKLLGERRVAMNQVEIHVYMQNRPIVEHCRKVGVPTTAYSPLARGKVVGDSLLEEIGKVHGAPSECVALAFLMAEGHAVIPSSGKQARIVRNFEAMHLQLSESEIARIRQLERGLRLVNGPWCPVWDE